MGAVYFYHLTAQPLEVTLRMLIEKSREQGWRVLVRGSDAMCERLDQQLWLGDDAGFLPHGRAGGSHDAAQPVLLGDGVAADGFDCLMTVGGAPVSATEVGLLDRACVLFDGADDAAVATAREQWRTLTKDGIAAQYWAQEDGRWVKKAESDPETVP